MAETEVESTTPEEPKTETPSSDIPLEFLKNPDPKAVDAFVKSKKKLTDDIDVDDFVYELDSQVKQLGEDKTRLDTAVQEAINRYSTARGMDSADFEQQMFKQDVNPLVMASDLSQGKERVDVIEGIKSRTLAGLTKEERKRDVRKSSILDIARQRGKAKIGRTIEETGEMAVELMFDDDQARFDETKDAGFFGTSLEDVKIIPKKGDIAYEEYSQINEMMERLAAEGDENTRKMVELRDKYKDAEQGAEQYVPRRVNLILNARGIFRPRALGGNEADEFIKQGRQDELTQLNKKAERYKTARSLATKQAIKEIATWKTLGLWTAPSFYRYSDVDFNDPNKEVSFSEALSPTVEIVGLDRNGKPVLRGQGAMQWGFEINDFIQSALVGAFNEDHADLGQRMLKGIAKRRNFFELALDSEAAKTNTGAKIALGGAGFLAAVLIPDLTFGAASVGKASKLKLGKFIKKGKLLDIANQHEEAAVMFAKALQSGDREQMRIAGQLGASLRGRFKVVMDRVDQSDFDAARRLARNNPDILGSKGRELADKLPGRLGDEKMNLHPSMRRRLAREGDGETVTDLAETGMEEAVEELSSALPRRVDLGPQGPQRAGGIGYDEVYKFGDLLDEVDKMRALVDAQDGSIYSRFIRDRVMGGGTGSYSRLFKLTNEAAEIVGEESAGQLIKAFKDFDSMGRDLDTYRKNTGKLIRSTLKGKGKKADKLLEKFIEPQEGDRFGAFGQLTRAAQDAKKEAGDFDEMGKLIDRAEEAINTNIESRAIAHAFDRSLIHGELGSKSSPIIVDSVAKVKEIKELSDEGIAFMDQAIDLFKVSKDEAIEASRIFDLASVRWANKTGRDASEWWQTRLKGFADRGDFDETFGVENPLNALVKNILHPAGRVQSALPEGYLLVGAGEGAFKLLGNPEAVRANIIKLIAKKYDVSEYGLRTNQAGFEDYVDDLGERLYSDEEVLFLSDLISSKDSPGLFLSKPPQGMLSGLQYGNWSVSSKKLQELLTEVDGKPPIPSKIKEIFSELENRGLLVREPESYEIIENATGKVLVAGRNLDRVSKEGIKKLVKQGVIKLSGEDQMIGHDPKVGPIVVGMGIDDVDQAIGGYNFEYGAAWINGVSFFRKEGQAYEVPFTTQEFEVLSLGENTQFTHNHPNYTWFSGGQGDMGFMAGNNVNEMRVVWPDGTVVTIEAPDGWGEIAVFTQRNMTGDLVDKLDQSGRIRNATVDKFQEWQKRVGSFVRGPSTRKANNARKAAEAKGEQFTQRDWAIIYTEEANRRLVELASSETFGVNIRASIRQPEESRKLGLDRPGPPARRLTSDLAEAQVEVTGDGAEVFFQGVQRQPGVEFRELSDGLIELTTQAVRDAGGDGLTFKIADDVLSIDAVSIPLELRGRGIGSDLYRNALEFARTRGIGFASDVSPSREAVAVYERLISEGVPLTRKIVRAADGVMVRQYVADAGDLRRVSRPATDASDFLSPAQARDRLDAVSDTPQFKQWFGDSKAVHSDPAFAGEPQVVFHGTNRTFDSFDFSRTGDGGNFLGRGAYFSTNPATAERFAKFRADEFLTDFNKPGTSLDPNKHVILNSVLSVRNPFKWPGGKDRDAGTLRGFMQGTGSLPDEIAEDVLAKLQIRYQRPTKKPGAPELVEKPIPRTFKQYQDQLSETSGVYRWDAESNLYDAVQDVLKEKGYDGVKRVDPETGSIEWVVFEPTQIKLVENIGTFDPTDPRMMYQTSLGGAAKGATEFLEDGRAIIYALEQPDFTTLVHEMGHILRRDLGVDDFEKVGGWVQSLGANVQMRAGRFIGDPEEVRKAEEFFAEAFEQYIKNGEPPVEELRTAFERMADFMTQAVQYLLPNAKVTPEMKQVFDDLLINAKPDESLLPRVARMVKETILGGASGAEFDTVKAISDEALRLGIDNADYDTLIKQLEDTGKIKLDGKIFADRYQSAEEGVSAGMDEFSSAELAQLRKNMQAEIETARISKMEVGTSAATSSFSQAIKEKSPSDTIDQLLSGDGGAARLGAIVKSSFIGGNVTKDKGLSNLPPTVRQRIETATRQVKQGTAEGIRLVGEATNEAGRKNLVDFLTGENVAYLKGGRTVLTSGHNSVASVMSGVRKYIQSELNKGDTMKDLEGLANHIGDGGKLESYSFGVVLDDVGKPFSKSAGEMAWEAMFMSKSAPKFLQNLLESVAPVTKGGANPLPKDWADFTEIVMYYSGTSKRGGQKFAGDDKVLVDSLMKEIEELYDKPSSMRVAVLFSTFGHAERARMLWSELGLAVDKKAFGHLTRWLNGEDIPAESVPAVKKLVARFGLRTSFVEEKLLDTTFYVPAAARNRLGDALMRGLDPDLKKQMGGKGGILKSENDIAGVSGALLRYNKLRMTRGGVALRQRYFLMNTIDHFAQMLMINGLGPAVGSTLRVITQDVMVLPGVARTIDTLSRTGAISPEAAEKVRKGLQKGGDKLAEWFSGAKYNININPILEGDTGFVTLGGNVYTNKELRDIAVEEGIFASFDTTQLSNSVQRAGRTMINERSRELSKLGKGKSVASHYASQTSDFLTQVVADTSEAWGERERLGAMISLMETGMAPRTAARLTIDALYDYAGSMSKMDRAWFVSLALPFWAFQKNANRQFLDTLFSPSGVYRMGVIRRGTERGADALTEIMWSSVSDEYGVDQRAMEENAPELYQDYMFLKKQIEDGYKGNVPEDVRIGMNQWLRGESSSLVDGGLYEPTMAAAPDEMSLGGIPKRYADFVRPLPSRSSRAHYMRDRAGVLVPFSLKEKATREYYNAIRNSKKDHGYAEVFFPDSTINAGMRHMSNMAAFYILLGTKGLNLLTDFDEGLSEVSLREQLFRVADLERAPLIGDTAKAITGIDGYPRRVHPFLKDIFENTFAGADMLQFEAKDDIYSPIDMREGVEYQEKRAYMFPGAFSIAFDNTLGELNNLLYDMDPALNLVGIEGRGRTSPAERAAQVRLLQWARSLVGAQIVESSPDQTASRESRKRLIETDKPD